MGLDQFWHVEGESKEFHYHRKVPALEAFMAAKWRLIPGNEDEVFNCQKLTVTEELLNELEIKVKNKTLDNHATGFFWGTHYDEDYDDMQDAINKARDKINSGNTVTYSSWW